MDKRRRKRNRRKSSHSRKNKKIVSRKKETKQKNEALFPFFLLLFFVFVGFYFFYYKKAGLSASDKVSQPETFFTLEERIKMKNSDIQMEQDIQLQDTLSEKLQKPVETIDELEPKVPTLDMEARFSDNASLEAVFEDLSEKPFKNDIYEDPEDIIRRQLAHQEWLEKHLEERNQREKEEFIRQFVKRAEEQGYRVHFGENMKVFLEPIDPEDKKEKKASFEKVKINWK